MKGKTHWAAPSYTLEGLIYLAAAHLQNSAEEEELTRRIAAYAFEHGCGIWHAAWVCTGKKGDCFCVPCLTSSVKP